MIIVPVDANLRMERPTVVCLGVFDGVHLGHAALVREARAAAVEKGLLVCAHTFDRLPARLLAPQGDIMELTPLPQKARLLEALGVEIVAVSAFDEAMMHMRAQDFFDGILVGSLRAAHLVVGFHHRFGRGGEADAGALAAMCARAGVGLTVVPPVTLPDGELISSTAIRALLRAAETEKAAEMLGRPYPAKGHL